MKEHPILFSGPMVQAILSGQKTVTRRAMKVQPQLLGKLWQVYGAGWSAGMSSVTAVPGHSLATKCPYGQVGDRLWVRESFADLHGTGVEHRPAPAGPLQRYAYAADSPPGSYADDARKSYGIKWKPSIHMPRTACRILLEVTAVRVERLQDISEQQALAEGIDRDELADAQGRYDMVADHNFSGRPTAAGAFRDLWAAINGMESWDANPWVWVVEFKRVTP